MSFSLWGAESVQMYYYFEVRLYPAFPISCSDVGSACRSIPRTTGGSNLLYVFHLRSSESFVSERHCYFLGHLGLVFGHYAPGIDMPWHVHLPRHSIREPRLPKQHFTVRLSIF